MLSISVGAVVIALVITIVAQMLNEADVVSKDFRNVCLISLGIWVVIVALVFLFGVYAMLDMSGIKSGN